jgi:hypothetical protein
MCLLLSIYFFLLSLDSFFLKFESRHINVCTCKVVCMLFFWVEDITFTINTQMMNEEIAKMFWRN